MLGLRVQEGGHLLWVHTSDGETSKVDLEDGEQARKWIRKLRDPSFNNTVTGLAICHLGVLYTLPRPRDFRQVSLSAELVPADPDRKIKGGERLLCFADETSLALMVHKKQRAVRVTLAKPGRRRFDPARRS